MKLQTKTNKTFFKLSADLIATFHTIWLVFVVASLPLSLRWKKLRYFGAATILTTVGSWLVFGDCPLFILENFLRKQYNPKAVYKGAFSSHYLKKYFSLKIPPKIFTATGYSYAALTLLLLLTANRK